MWPAHVLHSAYILLLKYAFYNTKKNSLTSGDRPAICPHFPLFGHNHFAPTPLFQYSCDNHPILYEAVDLNLKENYTNKPNLTCTWWLLTDWRMLFLWLFKAPLLFDTVYIVKMTWSIRAKAAYFTQTYTTKTSQNESRNFWQKADKINKLKGSKSGKTAAAFIH